jgi:hypothetical protein
MSMVEQKLGGRRWAQVCVKKEKEATFYRGRVAPLGVRRPLEKAPPPHHHGGNSLINMR